jgi:hypothetical protein
MDIEGFALSEISTADLTVPHDDGARCHIFATQSTDFHRCRDRKEAQFALRLPPGPPPYKLDPWGFNRSETLYSTLIRRHSGGRSYGRNAIDPLSKKGLSKVSP